MKVSLSLPPLQSPLIKVILGLWVQTDDEQTFDPHVEVMQPRNQMVIAEAADNYTKQAEVILETQLDVFMGTFHDLNDRGRNFSRACQSNITRQLLKPENTLNQISWSGNNLGSESESSELKAQIHWPSMKFY